MSQNGGRPHVATVDCQQLLLATGIFITERSARHGVTMHPVGIADPVALPVVVHVGNETNEWAIASARVCGEDDKILVTLMLVEGDSKSTLVVHIKKGEIVEIGPVVRHHS